MALIRRADVAEFAREPVVLELGDVERRAEAVRASAREYAEELISEAKAERERILQGATEEGRAEGLARGLEEGRKAGREEAYKAAEAMMAQRLSKLEDAWCESLDEFVLRRLELIREAKQALLGLAAAAAEKIVRKTVEVDSEVAARQVEATIDLVMQPSRLVILVHPDDVQVVERSMVDLAARVRGLDHVELRADESVGKGGCVIKRAGAPGLEMRAMVDEQLEAMARELAGEAGGAHEEEAA